MNPGFVHKIAVLGKDFYTLSTIDDLFIFAGADSTWWEAPTQEYGSQRMCRVYGWVDGINRHAPHQLNDILEGVALQTAENQYISESDKNFLKRHAGLPTTTSEKPADSEAAVTIPSDIEKLLEVLLRGLPRAMFPLKHRRQNLPSIMFDNEYDVQSLLHALLRPWIKDIRAEEYTPSYAGTSTRIDFLCYDYNIVVEVKYVRDSAHGRKIGDELIIDVAHYRAHPQCKQLWIVMFDPHGLVANPEGLINDLSGEHIAQAEGVNVRVFILCP